MLRLAAPKTTTAAPGLSRRCCRHRAQPPSTSGGVVVVTLDVVVYPFAPPSCVRTVGVVTDVDGDDVTISQLERELPDDGGSDADACWLISETEEEVVCHADEVLVIASDYGQRCDMDRIRNPHGEHAEEFWTLLEPLDDGVLVVERDTP